MIFEGSLGSFPMSDREVACIDYCLVYLLNMTHLPSINVVFLPSADISLHYWGDNKHNIFSRVIPGYFMQSQIYLHSYLHTMKDPLKDADKI